MMTILLPALTVSFAAFCVWLTVRIVNRRERWAKRTLAGVVGLPALYVLSFGPACWLDSRDMLPLAKSAYVPMRQFANDGPEPLRSFLSWYSFVGSMEVEWIPVTDFGGVRQMPRAVCPPSPLQPAMNHD
ncbi:MAG: hypothetical protein JSS02_19925 [Planctomycetes bacterium]|nr:hypothetical protein [Planctomycetota bacterium]